MITHRRNLNQIIDLTLPAAEIGCAEGYFAADILSWGVSKLYMVDAWQRLEVSGDGANPQSWHDKNLADAKARVSKYGDKAVILRGMSWQMAERVEDNSLGFINIDCDHSYEGVTRDIQFWFPKLVSKGIMSFHDHDNKAYGVERAVREFSNFYGLKINLLPEDKPEDAGAWIQKP